MCTQALVPIAICCLHPFLWLGASVEDTWIDSFITSCSYLDGQLGLSRKQGVLNLGHTSISTNPECVQLQTRHDRMVLIADCDVVTWFEADSLKTWDIISWCHLAYPDQEWTQLVSILDIRNRNFISSKMELCDTAPFHPQEVKYSECGNSDSNSMKLVIVLEVRHAGPSRKWTFQSPLLLSCQMLEGSSAHRFNQRAVIHLKQCSWSMISTADSCPFPLDAGDVICFLL